MLLEGFFHFFGRNFSNNTDTVIVDSYALVTLAVFIFRFFDCFVKLLIAGAIVAVLKVDIHILSIAFLRSLHYSCNDCMFVSKCKYV